MSYHRQKPAQTDDYDDGQNIALSLVEDDDDADDIDDEIAPLMSPPKMEPHIRQWLA